MSKQDRRIARARAADARADAIIADAIARVRQRGTIAMTVTNQFAWVSPKRPLTFQGIPAETWAFYVHRAPTGRRVTVARWLIDNPHTGHRKGDLLLRDVTGDGRTADFTVHAEKVVPAGTDADAEAFAKERLIRGA